MDDAAAMRLLQAFCNLRSILKYLVGRQWAFGQSVCERLAFQILHNEKIGPVLAANVEKSADVGVLQGGNGLGFALEPLFRVWPLRKIGWQYLDGDRPVETGVAGTINFAHSTRPCRGKDFVRPDSRAGKKWHSGAIIDECDKKT